MMEGEILALHFITFQKKTEIFASFFGASDVKNEGFVAAKRTFSNHTR